MREIEKALQFYYNDNGSFPVPGDGWDAGYNYNADARAEWLILQTALLPYISKLPTDPSDGDSFVGSGYMYYASNVPSNGSTGQGYTLIAYPTETTQSGWSCNFNYYVTNYPNNFLCLFQ